MSWACSNWRSLLQYPNLYLSSFCSFRYLISYLIVFSELVNEVIIFSFIITGPCDLAKDCKNNTACIGNFDGSVTCKCRTQDECPKDGDGVCGSDGQTYINKCQLDATACANNKQIQQLHVGPCGKKHNPVNFKEDFRLTLTDGVLQPGVPTTRSSYNQGSYNQGFLQPGVLRPGVLQPGVLTTRGLTNRGS